MNLQVTNIPGCFELSPAILKDSRGFFVKTFMQDFFKEKGLATQFAEEYYTFSYKGVLRGLHFQMPPMDHTKLVYCISGQVLDAVVDIRSGSPTYGSYQLFNLNDEKANMLYLSPGLAHGFYVLSQSAVLLYKVTTAYAPLHDTGILWSSVGIPWPDLNPIISKRDSEFAPFHDFKTPFIFTDGHPSE